MLGGNIEAGPPRLTPQEQEMAKWEVLEMNIPPDLPRLAEFRAITNKAKLAMLNLQIMGGRIDGGTQVEKSKEELKELYRQAVEIKAGAWTASLGQKLKLTPGTAIDAVLLKEIEPIKNQPGLESVGLDLEGIAKGLTVNPADVLQGLPASGNIYFISFKGAPAVQYEKVDASLALLDSISKDLLPLYPSFKPVIERLKTGLQHLDTINPIFSEGHKWQAKVKSGQRTMDTRPLKFVTAVGGGLLAGLGLASSLVNGHPILWPTFMWGGIAAYAMYPDMFDRGSAKSLRMVAALNTPLMQTLLGNNFRDKAFQELQEARRDPNKLKALKQLSNGSGTITNAEIGLLTDRKETALASSLLAIPRDQVRPALQMLGQSMNRGEQQLVASVLKGAPVQG